MSQLSQLVRRIRKAKILKGPNFRIEHRLAKRKVVRRRTDQPTLLFATLHKAASVYVWDILKDVAHAESHRAANLDGYYYHRGRHDHAIDLDLIHDKGFFYGPFRKGFQHVGQEGNRLNFEKFKVLIQLRDPRDALTSSYFSFLHSHCVVRKDKDRMESIRARMSNQDIKQHVWGQAGFLKQLLESYIPFFGQPNCLVVHYEDMILQPQKWVGQIARFLDVKGNRQAMRGLYRVVDAAADRPQTEQVNSHKRKVTPGDFRSKLPPDLIENLNHRYANYFDALKRLNLIPESYQLQHRRAS